MSATALESTAVPSVVPEPGLAEAAERPRTCAGNDEDLLPTARLAAWVAAVIVPWGLLLGLAVLLGRLAG